MENSYAQERGGERALNQKIAKLLALAENDGASEAESQAALAKAVKLAAEHGLELAACRGALEGNDDISFEEGEARVLGKRLTPLDRAVADIIEKVMRVEVFWRTQGGRKKLMVFSTAEKTAFALASADFLYDEMPRLVKERGFTGAEKVGYYLGLADGYIAEAQKGGRDGEEAAKARILEREGVERAEEAGRNYAIAILSEGEQRQAAFKKAYPRMGSIAPSRATYCVGAYDKGLMDGRNISVKPRLTSR